MIRSFWITENTASMSNTMEIKLELKKTYSLKYFAKNIKHSILYKS
jgi:hypothetical protein